MASLNLQNCINIPDDYNGNSYSLWNGIYIFCYLQVTKQIFSVFPTTTKMQLEMFLFLMVTEIVKMQCVSYNYDLGMIQDRIEKLGRDVFYDMLSCGREPLHALCVLKVSSAPLQFFFKLFVAWLFGHNIVKLRYLV